MVISSPLNPIWTRLWLVSHGFGQFPMALALTALGCIALWRCFHYSSQALKPHTRLPCPIWALNLYIWLPPNVESFLTLFRHPQLGWPWNGCRPYSAWALIPHTGLFPVWLPLSLHLLHLGFKTLYAATLKCGLCLHPAWDLTLCTGLPQCMGTLLCLLQLWLPMSSCPAPPSLLGRCLCHPALIPTSCAGPTQQPHPNYRYALTVGQVNNSGKERKERERGRRGSIFARL